MCIHKKKIPLFSFYIIIYFYVAGVLAHPNSIQINKRINKIIIFFLANFHVLVAYCSSYFKILLGHIIADISVILVL